MKIVLIMWIIALVFLGIGIASMSQQIDVAMKQSSGELYRAGNAEFPKQ